MNTIAKIFLAAGTACCLILGLAFLAGEKQNTQPKEPLYKESLAHLKELCRIKYRQSLRYKAYSLHAKRDSLPATALLFEAMSKADAIHFQACRHALNSLGGVFLMPVIAPTRLLDHTQHLEDALKSKNTTHQQHIPLYISQALKQNNRYIARLLTWCDASDLKQIALLKIALQDNAPRKMHHRFYICPTCGDIKWEEATLYCPYCMTDSGRYIILSATLGE